MKMLLTVDRIRSVIDSARTEKDLETSLRSHKIRFSYDTSAGFLALRVPARSGTVLIYRTASCSAPFAIRSASAVSAFPIAPASAPLVRYPLPVLRNDD